MGENAPDREGVVPTNVVRDKVGATEVQEIGADVILG
jgi:hypothetical protein